MVVLVSREVKARRIGLDERSVIQLSSAVWFWTPGGGGDVGEALKW
jgi:hypothetical protein